MLELPLLAKDGAVAATDLCSKVTTAQQRKLCFAPRLEDRVEQITPG